MTPEPPAPSDGSSLPSRHRPTLGNLAQDTTEIDLWAFEDDFDLPDDPKKGEAVEGTSRSSGRDIPEPRERQTGKSRESDHREAAKTAGAEEQIRMNVTKKRSVNRPSTPASGPSKPESDFDDLDSWEDAKQEPEIDELPVVILPGLPEVMEIPELINEEKEAEPSTPEPAPLPPASAISDDEFSPVRRQDAAPVSLRPLLRLSKTERVGLIVLVLLLFGGGATVFLSSINRLPVESEKADTNDFPIKGDHLVITSAKSYWRAPITSGANVDTFRRGTQLLPVLELTTSGGPASIRVFFRDDEGRTIGDALTLSVRSEGVLKIPATAGFDDPGMHAAYRTGESKPWTIEVREITSGDASNGNSKKLFEMNISTDRH